MENTVSSPPRDKQNGHAVSGRFQTRLRRVGRIGLHILGNASSFVAVNILAATIPASPMILAPLWQQIFRPIRFAKRLPEGGPRSFEVGSWCSDNADSKDDAVNNQGLFKRRPEPVSLCWTPDFFARPASANEAKIWDQASRRKVRRRYVEMAHHLLQNVSQAEAQAVYFHEIGHHETAWGRVHHRLSQWERAARDITYKYTAPVALAYAAMSRFLSVEQAGNLYEKALQLPVLGHAAALATPVQFKQAAGLVTNIVHKALGDPHNALLYAGVGCAVLYGASLGVLAFGRQAEFAADRFAAEACANVDGLTDFLMRCYTGNDSDAKIPMRTVLGPDHLRPSARWKRSHPHPFERIRALYRYAEKNNIQPALTAQDMWHAKPPFASHNEMQQKLG